MGVLHIRIVKAGSGDAADKDWNIALKGTSKVLGSPVSIILITLDTFLGFWFLGQTPSLHFAFEYSTTHPTLQWLTLHPRTSFAIGRSGRSGLQPSMEYSMNYRMTTLGDVCWS